MNAGFLKLVSRICASKKGRQRLAKSASVKKLNSLRNICYNLCNCKYMLDEDVKTRLLPYKKDIRIFADNAKLRHAGVLKKHFVQHGGFFQILLPAILGLAVNLAGTLIERAIPK
jgi:hypothetical protein